jgi:hypothetical protein
MITRAVGNDTVAGGSTLSGTITTPVGIGPNDLSIIFSYEQVNTGSIGATSDPSGWTPVPGFTYPILGSGSGGTVAWYKIGAPANTVVTWPWLGTALSWGAICLAYSGVDLSNPFGTQASAASAAVGLNPTVPSIFTTADSSEVIAITGIGSSATTFTAIPAAYSKWPVENGTGKRIGAADQLITVAGGASGATSWTTSGTVTWTTIVLELLAVSPMISNPQWRKFPKPPIIGGR